MTTPLPWTTSNGPTSAPPLRSRLTGRASRAPSSPGGSASGGSGDGAVELDDRVRRESPSAARRSGTEDRGTGRQDPASGHGVLQRLPPRRRDRRPRVDAAKAMVRRAAEVLGRVEDAMVFHGVGPGGAPTGVDGDIVVRPVIYTVTGGRRSDRLVAGTRHDFFTTTVEADRAQELRSIERVGAAADALAGLRNQSRGQRSRDPPPPPRGPTWRPRSDGENTS